MPFANHALVSLSWLLALSPAMTQAATSADATALRTLGQVRSPMPLGE
jgi:hypothetical protein